MFVGDKSRITQNGLIIAITLILLYFFTSSLAAEQCISKPNFSNLSVSIECFEDSFVLDLDSGKPHNVCIENDISELLFQLDGAGAVLKQLGYELAKEVRMAKMITSQQRKFKQNIIDVVDQYYIELWSHAWTIPSKHYDCSSNLACTTINDSLPLEVYRKKLFEFTKFIITQTRLLKRNGVKSNALKQIRKLAHSEKAATLLISTQVPTTYYKCN